jgi:hypothetical protein
MTEAKPLARKRVIVGWRQVDRRKAEIRSKQQSAAALTPKRAP